MLKAKEELKLLIITHDFESLLTFYQASKKWPTTWENQLKKKLKAIKLCDNWT